MVYGVQKVLAKIGGEDTHCDLIQAIKEDISAREAAKEAKMKKKKDTEERLAQEAEKRREEAEAQEKE